MSSRKRKNSPIPIPETSVSNKRAKLLSSLWNSQEEASTEIVKNNESRVGPSRSKRTSRGEKPKQYIVDWQNRQATGEKSNSSLVGVNFTFTVMCFEKISFLQKYDIRTTG